MIKFCLGCLTGMFQFCLGDRNSASKAPGLPTLMLLPENRFIINKTVAKELKHISVFRNDNRTTYQTHSSFNLVDFISQRFTTFNFLFRPLQSLNDILKYDASIHTLVYLDILI